MGDWADVSLSSWKASSASSWKVVIPNTNSNYVLNPSAETTGNYVARAAATVTRVNTDLSSYPPRQTHGLWSYEVVCTGAGDGIDLTLESLTGFGKLVSCYVQCTTQPPPLRWTLNGGTDWFAFTLVMQVTDDWYWYYAIEAGSLLAATTTLSIESTAAGAITFYLDSVMVTTPYTDDTTIPITYLDGDQPGCVWSGTPHASRSKRMNVVRSGGALFDIQDDLHFDVGLMLGSGAATHEVTTEGMALLPGAQITGDKLDKRSFGLGGVIRGTSFSNLHSNKQELLSALSGHAVPELSGQKQLVQLWYTGALPVKYIDAAYEQGLEGRFNARDDPCAWEQNVAIQFVAPDPLWRSVVETSTPLAAITSATAYCVTARLNTPTTGQTYFGKWDGGIEIGSIAAGAGGGTVVYAAVWGPDNKLYIGGDFQNLDGIAACDHIACYDPIAYTWAAVGAAGLNHVVRALAFGPDGTLYAGGLFTNAGGDANADYLAQIDPDAAVPVWSNVGGGPGAGAVTAIYALCVDINGNLIIGGHFTDWTGDSDMDYAVRFDGTNYVQFDGAELNGIVYAVAASPDGYVYFGGAFTTGGGLTLNRVARWLPGTDAYLALDAGGSGVDDVVRTIEVDGTGRRVWIGGDFHNTTGGEATAHICMWNGTNFEALGSGVTGPVFAIALGADDTLWVGGDFTTVTGVGACSGIVTWVGKTWCPVDVQFVAVPNVYCFGLSDTFPPTVRNYNVVVGFDATVTMYFSDTMLVDTLGTFLAYPEVIFMRTGAVTGRLGNVRIGPTGAQLYLNYTMQLGETLTIDTAPQRKTVISNFYGLRPDALLPPSNMGEFALLPQWQGQLADVYWFAEDTGDTDLDCFLLWRDTFESQD